MSTFWGRVHLFGSLTSTPSCCSATLLSSCSWYGRISTAGRHEKEFWLLWVMCIDWHCLICISYPFDLMKNTDILLCMAFSNSIYCFKNHLERMEAFCHSAYSGFIFAGITRILRFKKVFFFVFALPISLSYFSVSLVAHQYFCAKINFLFLFCCWTCWHCHQYWDEGRGIIMILAKGAGNQTQWCSGAYSQFIAYSCVQE